MRSLALALVVVTACASSRVRGDGDDREDAAGDDVDGAGLDDATVDVPPDAAPVTLDAPDVAPCTSTSGVETIQEWPQTSSGLQSPLALAVGPDGEIVVAYNVGETPIVLATRAADGTWPTAPLAAHFGSRPSLAFAPDGTLHACYVRARPYERGWLECASRPPGGAWSTMTVDYSPSQSPSLAIAPSGRPGVGYGRDEGVAVATRSPSGGSWNVAVTPASYANSVSLAYDAQGLAYLAWRESSGPWPTIQEQATGLVDGNFAWVMPRSLAVDGAGRVHLAFASNRNGEVAYAYRDADNVWHHERDLDGDGDIWPYSIALALGDNGAVHVAYYARQPQLGEANEIRLATRAPGGGWSTDVLHTSLDYYPGTIDLAARDGVVHVAFESVTVADPQVRHVYYARRCGAADPP